MLRTGTKIIGVGVAALALTACQQITGLQNPSAAIPESNQPKNAPIVGNEVRKAVVGKTGMILTPEGRRKIRFGPRTVVYSFVNNSWTRTGKWNVKKRRYCVDKAAGRTQCYRVYQAGSDEYKVWAPDRPFGRLSIGSDPGPGGAPSLGPSPGASPDGSPGSPDGGPGGPDGGPGGPDSAPE